MIVRVFSNNRNISKLSRSTLVQQSRLRQMVLTLSKELNSNPKFDINMADRMGPGTSNS